MIEKVYFSYDITFDIVEQFMQEEPNKYDLYLTTNGGDGYASIYFADFLKKSKKLRDVICIGEVNSGGCIILSVLNKIKKRKAYNYISFMLHLLRMDLNITNMSISHFKNIVNSTYNLNNKILELLIQNLDLSKEDIFLLQNGVDLIWTPEIAKEKGLIDEIL